MKRLFHACLRGQMTFALALLFLVSVFGVLAWQAKTAYANYGSPPDYTGYFTNASLPTKGYFDVIYNGLTATTSISNFEQQILAIHSSGQDSQCYTSYSGATHCAGWAIGADFIIQTMRGGTDTTRPGKAAIADWENRLSNPDIQLISQYYCSSGANSGYLNGDVAWVYQPQCGTSLEFVNKNNNAQVYYIIREGCGNPMGSLGGLPAYTPPPPPPPNQPPVGGITGGAGSACTAITGWMYDPDTPSTKLSWYIYVNPPAGTPGSYASRGVAPAITSGFRGPGTANANNPPGTPAGTPAGHGFSQDISASLKLYNYKGDWVANTYAIYAQDANTGELDRIATITQTPCARVACSTTTFGGLVVGQQTKFSVSVRVTGATSNPPDSLRPLFAIVVVNSSGVRQPLTGGGSPPTWAAVPGHDYGGAYSSGVISSPTNGQTAGFTPTAAGAYQVAWSYNVNGTTWANCGNSPTQAAFSPYFNVLGGDVAAGPGFGANCSTNGAAGISGNNLDPSGSGPFYGAGTQLAALAMGSISSFATSQNADGSNAGAGVGSGLAFANTGSSGTNYGGNYGRTTWCVPDYVSNATAHATAVPTSGSIDVSALPEGVTYVNGDTTIYSSLPLPLGRHATLVVKGNVFISGNITYTAYTQTADIPQFRLLVTGGSIYIGNTVGELHGFYDAQPNSVAGSGTIYTCATALGTAISGTNPATDYGTCNHPLTIYGGVAADSIKFGRTYGSLTAAGGVTNQPAEKIVFSPELWLGDLSGPNGGCTMPDAGVSGCSYQAFAGLPPVL